MKEIPLTKGKVALIDEGDYERVSAFKWHARPEPNGRDWYAVRKARVGELANGAATRSVSLHRFILNAPPTIQVDHINHDGLDCRRQNLRLATRSQQRFNTRRLVTNTSGFKGVGRSGNRWRANIKKEGHNYHIGQFGSGEEAARAYDAKAKELFGEFACLNFPDDSQKEK